MRLALEATRHPPTSSTRQTTVDSGRAQESWERGVASYSHTTGYGAGLPLRRPCAPASQPTRVPGRRLGQSHELESTNVSSVTSIKTPVIVWMYWRRIVTLHNGRMTQSAQRRFPFALRWETKLMRRSPTTPQSRHWLAPLRNSLLTRYAGVGTAESGRAPQ